MLYAVWHPSLTTRWGLSIPFFLSWFVYNVCHIDISKLLGTLKSYVARTLKKCRRYVSDTPKVLHFWRIRHWYDNIFRESEQHCLKVSIYLPVRLGQQVQWPVICVGISMLCYFNLRFKAKNSVEMKDITENTVLYCYIGKVHICYS